MNIGDIIDSAIWVTGDEPPELRDIYEADVTEAIDYLCYENKLIHGPVTFEERHPMSEDAPEVPDHVSGSRVRLLVAEATITDNYIPTSVGSFVAQLEHKDLIKLRTIIRKYRTLSDIECDEIIEEIGPEAALDTLKSIH